jgi:predicted RNase H-like HicB family nuclease
MMIYLTTRNFTVTIEKDKETGYYTAQCVELPAAISQGKTEEEAKENIKEAIQLVLEYLEEKAGLRKHKKKLIEVAV